jgi:REase_AHJR-like
MTKHEMLEQVAEKYRSEGYRVTMAAEEGGFPQPFDHLRDDFDLFAQKGDEYVAIEVKRRDQLHEISPQKPGVRPFLPGWSYDLVVYPPDLVDGMPLEDGEPSPEYVDSLLAEAQQSLDSDKLRAAFVLVWSAIESAMRSAARREGLEIGDRSPRFVLRTLYSNGFISYEDFDRLQRRLDERDRLVHGLSVDHVEPDDIRFLIEFARQLQCATPASSDA